MRHFLLSAACVAFIVAQSSMAAAEETRTQDFSNDPGWEGYRNRLLPDPVPTARQDFGYRPTQHAGGQAAGEIGGWVQRSATPAFYAREIPRRSLNDKLAASGKFAVTSCQNGSGAMLGWFQEPMRSWRAANSLGVRIDGNGGKYWVLFEYSTRHWMAGGRGTFDGKYQTTKTKPFLSDGTVHQWSLVYDPAAHENLGELTFVLDGVTYLFQLPAGHKTDGADFDRFGLFNAQLPGKAMELYFDDLIIDGFAERFDRDPGWLKQNNEGLIPQRFVRPLHDFGFSKTNVAGGNRGEVGGIIWRDPKGAYYADPVGPFTLNDELAASGTVVLKVGNADSGACFGWFDSASRRNESRAGETTPKNVLAIYIEGPSSIGHYFRPCYATASGVSALPRQGPVIRPDGQPHHWSLHYDPRGAQGRGQITWQLDDDRRTFELAPGHKQLGASFDRFGVLAFEHSDGQSLEYYLDDLTYSAEKE